MSELSEHIKSTLGENSTATVSRGFLAKVLAYVCEAVTAGFSKQSERIEQLERKVDGALQKGGSIRYAGVYRVGKSYEAGQFATYQGGLWHCNEDTDTKPGSGPHWTLAVKSGEAR